MGGKSQLNYDTMTVVEDFVPGQQMRSVIGSSESYPDRRG